MSKTNSIEPELLHHYPWLPSLKTVYSDIATQEPSQFVSELFDTNGPFIRERIMDFFTSSFNNLETIRAYEINDLNIYLYLFLKILLFTLDVDIITNRIANLYSKITYSSLIDENDYNIYQICQDLDLDLKYFEEAQLFRQNELRNKTEKLTTHYKLHYIDYIKMSAHLQDKYRKLVNNPISGGYVFILRKDIARLLQEYVRKKILEIGSKNRENTSALRELLLKVDDFKDIYNKIIAIWEKKKEEFTYSIEIGFEEGTDISHLFPPCIKHILSQAKEGKNLSHNERLFLVFFLHALEYPIEKIVDVFSTMPDFDREKTHYQVSFAKNKGYTPHSCKTLKSLNLCRASEYHDDLCLEGYHSKKKDERRKISHPLFYVQFQQYQEAKQENGK